MTIKLSTDTSRNEACSTPKQTTQSVVYTQPSQTLGTISKDIQQPISMIRWWPDPITNNNNSISILFFSYWKSSNKNKHLQFYEGSDSFPILIWLFSFDRRTPPFLLIFIFNHYLGTLGRRITLRIMSNKRDWSTNSLEYVVRL